MNKENGAYDSYNITNIIQNGIGLTTRKNLNQEYFIFSMMVRSDSNKPVLQVSYNLSQLNSNGSEKIMEEGVISVDYDFENKKVKDFKQIYKKEIKEN